MEDSGCKCVQPYNAAHGANCWHRFPAADIGIKFTKSGHPKNMGTAVGIAFLSSLEHEMQLLPVCRPPYYA
jgi:hypothetical protein